MLNTLKQEWYKLRQHPPGKRFQARYERHRAARGGGGLSKRRIARVVAGLLAVAIGVVLVFIPGPAILLFAVGGGLIASESLRLARFLDGCEVRLRTLGRWTRRRWGGLTPVARAGCVGVAAGTVAAGVYLSYRLMLW